LQFKFAFLWWLVMLNIFSHTYWPCVCLLLRNVYSDAIWIFNSIICLLVIELFEFLIHVGYWLLIKYLACKYFLPSHKLCVHFVDCILCCAEAFQFLLVCLLLLLLPVYGVISKKLFPWPISRSFSSLFSSSSFTVSGYIFKSVIHLEMIFFMYSVMSVLIYIFFNSVQKSPLR
jgi:hypothetical protein